MLMLPRPALPAVTHWDTHLPELTGAPIAPPPNLAGMSGIALFRLFPSALAAAVERRQMRRHAASVCSVRDSTDASRSILRARATHASLTAPSHPCRTPC